jgi:CheY-like chemotaxis protein
MVGAHLTMKILIAEDNRTAARFIRGLVEGCGHEVVVAPDGEAAWEILQKGDTSLLISDWIMP